MTTTIEQPRHEGVVHNHAPLRSATPFAPERAQREGVDSFRLILAAALGRTLDVGTWTFRCPSGDWTQGEATWAVDGGKLTIRHIARSGHWSVAAERDGREVYFRGDLPCADLANAVSRGTTVLLCADVPTARPAVPDPCAGWTDEMAATVAAAGDHYAPVDLD